MAKKGIEYCHIPDIDNPLLKEDVECMMGVMSEDSTVSSREIQLSSYVYPGLITHNMVSIQPCSENSFSLAGHGGEHWYEVNQIKFERPESVKIGRINSKFTDDHDSVSFYTDVAVSATNGWDQFIIEKIEELAGIKSYIFAMWGVSVSEHISCLKDNVERNSGLPVTWVMMSYKTLSYLQQDGRYTPCFEEKQYVSGHKVGRWRHADVYCVENMPRDTVALMGYKGNTNYDAPFVVGINKVLSIQEGRKYSSLYGTVEIIPAWDNFHKAIGKLKIA